MGQYTLTNEAESDIVGIVEYINERSPRGAINVAREIRRICSLVGDMPLIGHVVEGVGVGELLHLPAGKYSDYLVFYVVVENTPVIVRVIHAKRDIPTLLNTWYNLGQNERM